jgi:hypothetical protein
MTRVGFLGSGGWLTSAPPDWAIGGDFDCSAPATVINGDRHAPDPPSR